MATSDVVTDNLDIWTSAIQMKSSSGRGRSGKLDLYGIKKLRELILDLAVRGLLVRQDPDDEPASELLKKIRDEKANLIKEGKIKKRKLLPDISDHERLSPFPPSWEMARLNDIGDWGAGATPSRRKPELFSGQIPWFKSGELVGDFISQSEENVTEGALNESSLRLNNIGDVLVAMYGANIGQTSIVSVTSTTNQAVCACTPYSGVENKYLLTLVKSLKKYFISIGAGGAQPNISREKIIATPFALPPTNEQKRIVTKVDELMTLCDQLEAEQESGIESHETLVITLLESLTSSIDSEGFEAAWKRVAEHFDTLFTTESSVDQLKQTILQLAVMGKLVLQDTEDEPASELLKRIKADKTVLVKKKKIKKQTKLSVISEDEKPFQLPNGWEWARFFAVNTAKSELVKAPEHPDKFQVAPDSIEKNTGRIIEKRTVSQSGAKGPNNIFLEGQLLYSKIRPSLNKVAIAPYDGLCSADMYPIDCHINIQYMLNVMLSEVFLTQVRVAENRVKMPKINLASLGLIMIPVPPLNEQKRIKNKVAELMLICDEFKSQIAEAKKCQLQLADALTSGFSKT